MKNGLILGIIICLIIIVLYIQQETYIQSSIDGKYYSADEDHSANLLAIINLNTTVLMKHLKNKYHKSHPLVNNLLVRYDPDAIYEHTPSLFNSQVAYTNNKGQALYICLKNTKSNQFHDINLLMFVALHEISHISTNVRQHPKEFWEVFKFILHESVHCNIYKPVHYHVNPNQYCNGMEINYNPYFDSSLNIQKYLNSKN